MDANSGDGYGGAARDRYYDEDRDRNDLPVPAPFTGICTGRLSEMLGERFPQVTDVPDNFGQLFRHVPRGFACRT